MKMTLFLCQAAQSLPHLFCPHLNPTDSHTRFWSRHLTTTKTHTSCWHWLYLTVFHRTPTPTYFTLIEYFPHHWSFRSAELKSRFVPWMFVIVSFETSEGLYSFDLPKSENRCDPWPPHSVTEKYKSHKQTVIISQKINVSAALGCADWAAAMSLNASLPTEDTRSHRVVLHVVKLVSGHFCFQGKQLRFLHFCSTSDIFFPFTKFFVCLSFLIHSGVIKGLDIEFDIQNKILSCLPVRSPGSLLKQCGVSQDAGDTLMFVCNKLMLNEERKSSHLSVFSSVL